MDWLSLPKIELHLHLDCSISLEALRQFEPDIAEAYFESHYKAPAKCLDLPHFLACARRSIDMMQTKAQLRVVTLDLLQQLRRENVQYAEIRFAPFEHIRKGLSPEAVVETVLEAMEEGCAATGIRAGLLLCTLRELPADKSLYTAQLAVQYHGRGVVGFDMAGNEADFPIDAHIPAFRHARERGVPCIAHAGEARGAEEIWRVIRELQVVRIGHGVRCTEDPRLVEYIAEKEIHLEVCPTSNVQTNVYNTIEDHPIDRLYRAGISLSVNTDSRTLTNTTLEREYALLHQHFGWGEEEFKRCNQYAEDASFVIN
jgi:adenosine deaminase